MFTTNKEYRRLSADRAGSHSVAGHGESTSEESQQGHAWAGTFSSPLGLVLGIHQPAAKAIGSKVCHDKYTGVFLVWFGLYFFQVQAVCFSLSMKSAAESCHPAAPRAPCPLPAKSICKEAFPLSVSAFPLISPPCALAFSSIFDTCCCKRHRRI